MPELVYKKGAELMRILISKELLSPGAKLVLYRPRRHERHSATVGADGSIQLVDGRTFESPSRAAAAAAKGLAHNGWILWRVGGEDGPLLSELRKRLRTSE